MNMGENLMMIGFIKFQFENKYLRNSRNNGIRDLGYVGKGNRLRKMLVKWEKSKWVKKQKLFLVKG